ncbi:MAG TPA: phosphoglucosamine mutase, partial [Bdellovibrionales bacterium]|nr:phosphoglucosamine mutase [Bdellovibrionales bacterium]
MVGRPKLFGTDGIRGTSNTFPMTTDVVLRVGQALGYLLTKDVRHKEARVKVVIGKDTRLANYMLEQALSSGLNSMGVHVQLVGPLPTPGIGFVTRNMRADAGIVISASHNQYQDSGIKIFGPDGYKISSNMESEIERLVAEEDLNALLPTADGVGRSRRIDDAAGRYVVYVKNTFPLDQTLDGMRIVLDCANGAGYKVAPAVLEELGAELIVLGNTPNGTNINFKCGALHPENMAEAVKTYRADVGISLDGDADRVIMADEKGNVVNGDHILAVCAIDLHKRKKLTHDTVVATEMSNFGLERAMEKAGVKLVKVKVGDKYVVEEMRKSGYCLGGESSGHIIFKEHSTTGDGLVAALAVLGVMKQTGKTLSTLRSVMEDVPQVLRNIRVTKRLKLEDVKGYKELVEGINKKLKGEGRSFIRFSGTEPLVRVLVEGPDAHLIASYADEIGDLL